MYKNIQKHLTQSKKSCRQNKYNNQNVRPGFI